MADETSPIQQAAYVDKIPRGQEPARIHIKEEDNLEEKALASRERTLASAALHQQRQGPLSEAVDQLEARAKTQMGNIEQKRIEGDALRALKTGEGLMAKLKGLPNTKEVMGHIAEVQALIQKAEADLAKIRLSQDYLARESSPRRVAEITASDLHGGVDAVSGEMTGALHKQDLAKEKIAQEEKVRGDIVAKIVTCCENNNLRIQERDVPPTDVCQILLDKHEHDFSFSERDLALAVGTIVGLKKALAEVVGRRFDVQVDDTQYYNYFKAGMEGFGAIGMYNDPKLETFSRVVDAFERAATRRNPSGRRGYDIMGAAYLDQQMEHVPPTENVDSHVMAFAMGIVMGGSISNVDTMFPHWLIGLRPIVRKDGQTGRLGLKARFGDQGNDRQGNFSYDTLAQNLEAFNPPEIAQLVADVKQMINQVMDATSKQQGVAFASLNALTYHLYGIH